MQEPDETIDFEAALAELETLVNSMEEGSLSLDDSLAAFERGVKLSRDCQAALRAAELRVKALTEDAALEPPPTDQQPTPSSGQRDADDIFGDVQHDADE